MEVSEWKPVMYRCGSESKGGVYPEHWMMGLEWSPQAPKSPYFAGQRRTCIRQVVCSNQRLPEIQYQQGKYLCKTKLRPIIESRWHVDRQGGSALV